MKAITKSIIRMCDLCNKGKRVSVAEQYKIRQGLSLGRHKKCAREAMGNYTTNKRIVHKVA